MRERQNNGTERGPSLLAWWEDEFGRPWQFIQKSDWFAVRYRKEGEWRYLGDWISYSDKHGTTNRSLQSGSDQR